jgi:hypothetical protein
MSKIKHHAIYSKLVRPITSRTHCTIQGGAYCYRAFVICAYQNAIHSHSSFVPRKTRDLSFRLIMVVDLHVKD